MTSYRYDVEVVQSRSLWIQASNSPPETRQRKSLKRGAGKTSDVMGALRNGAMCGKSRKNRGVREGPRCRVMRGRRTKGEAGEEAILQLGVVQAEVAGAEGKGGGEGRRRGVSWCETWAY